MSGSSQIPDPRRDADPLTAREREILGFVARGDSSPAIARQLGIAENTIKAHLANIYRKTGARNRVQATRFYLSQYGEASDR
jgi:two-component system, NarL family, nitrate/nitrite response regulator NarL